MDDKYLPWEDDDIVFVPGDWEIERADEEGLYNYSICGIRAARSVDGVRLVEWHMAEFIRYSMLTPWEGAGIQLSGVTDVARDILDFSYPESERKYLVIENKKLLRVNRFYLVHSGLATAVSDEFKEKVRQQAISAVKYNKCCTPWPSDDIIIDPPAGITVERAVASGRYRVGRGDGSKTTYTAERLIADKFAKESYEVKLAEMSESEKASMSSYKDGTCGFWLCDHPNAVKTLRDIAKLWADLEKCYDGKLAPKIMSHNRNIFIACSKQEQLLENYNRSFAALDRDIKAHDDALNELDDTCKKLEQYKNMRIDSYFGEYDSLKAKFTATCARIAELRKQISESVERLKAMFVGIGGDDRSADVFPIDVLPAKLKDIMRAEYQKIMSFKSGFDGTCAILKARAGDYSQRLEDSQDRLDRLNAQYRYVDAGVQAVLNRRRQLDEAKNAIDAKLLNSKPLMAKKIKTDRIKLITKVKITVDGGDKYTIHDTMGKGLTVNAAELIYMGLAQYY